MSGGTPGPLKKNLVSKRKKKGTNSCFVKGFADKLGINHKFYSPPHKPLRERKEKSKMVGNKITYR
jgi:hypothetical protein